MSYSIFVSYRKEDSSTAVSSLVNDLQSRFGKNEVFVDAASIQSGDAWKTTIRKSVKEAKIVLVVIGNNWLCKEKDIPGQLRICSKDDWVRQEIESAQKLKNKLIVPVLINGAEMPDHPDLPESIKALRDLHFRRINIQPGDNEGARAFIDFLQEELNDRNSPDELKKRLQNILAHKYEIKKHIGSGNRAKVYLCLDKGLQREVAIKVIVNPDFNGEFVDTLKVAAKINDCVPNCVPILGAYVDKNPYHVITTFLRQGSLRKKINERGGTPLPYIDIKKILLDTGNALKKTHSIRLAHCNVKPSNIILNDQLDAYINPLSRRIQVPGDATIISKLSDLSAFTDVSVYREELCYLAPEIFDKNPGNDSDNEWGEKIDQYMLGLLGYELLTGDIPNTLTDINDLDKNRVAAFKTLGKLTEIRKDCPYEMSKIIHKMIDHDPDNRFHCLEDAIDAIAGVSFDVYEIAKDSYARCITNSDSGNTFFRTFYRELIKTSPEAAEKFKGKGIGEAESSKQYSILREAIFILLMFGKNNLGVNEPNILSRIAQMHNGDNYKVSPKAYKAFLDALTATVCGLSPDIPEPFDSQCKINGHERDIIKKAWEEALKPGIEYMKSKYFG